MKQELLDSINDYLSERVDGDGDGWSPVSDDEMWKLSDIIGLLVAEKYEEDADGDLPINWELINRNTHKPTHHAKLPYDTDGESLDRDCGIVKALEGIRYFSNELDMRMQLFHAYQRMAGTTPIVSDK